MLESVCVCGCLVIQDCTIWPKKEKLLSNCERLRICIAYLKGSTPDKWFPVPWEVFAFFFMMHVLQYYHKLTLLCVTCASNHTALTHHCRCNFRFFHYLLQLCTSVLPVCTYHDPSKLQVSESLPCAFVYTVYLCYIMHYWYQGDICIQFRVVGLYKRFCIQHCVLTFFFYCAVSV